MVLTRLLSSSSNVQISQSLLYSSTINSYILSTSSLLQRNSYFLIRYSLNPTLMHYLSFYHLHLYSLFHSSLLILSHLSIPLPSHLHSIQLHPPLILIILLFITIIVSLIFSKNQLCCFELAKVRKCKWNWKG